VLSQRSGLDGRTPKALSDYGAAWVSTWCLDDGGIVQSMHQVIAVGLRVTCHGARLQARSTSSRGYSV
jgi:hypothetical protein